MSSNWAKTGGYIDFQTYAYYVASGVFVYWGAATALSVTVMSAGLGYIVHEYCTQSHFSTEHYGETMFAVRPRTLADWLGRAMKGLKHTRRFKKHTRFVRTVPDTAIRCGKWVWWKVSGGMSRRGRRSLIWTADTQLYRLSNLGYR